MGNLMPSVEVNSRDFKTVFSEICPQQSKIGAEHTSLRHQTNKALSVTFSIICIVDLFGVFPLVALPKPIIECGYYGIFVVLGVCSMQIYTATLLGKCWVIAEDMDPMLQQKNRYPYSALAQITYGSFFAKCVNFLIDLTVFGGGIPNLIVASQNLQLLSIRLSNDNFDLSFCYWILIVGIILCPVLWFGSPKDMKFICALSVGIVVAVFLLLCGGLISSKGLQNPKINYDYLPKQPLWRNILNAYGIIAFQFDVHPSILTIQVDMKDKTKLTKAIIGGFVASLVMFGVISIITAVKYGSSIQPSILETLPSTIALHLTAGLVALQLCLTSAVSNSALYQHMEDCLKISRDFNHKRCILRTILTLLAVVIAESVPRFDLVMSLIGGTLTSPLVFILPPLFYIKVVSLKKRYKAQLEDECFTNIVGRNVGHPGNGSFMKYKFIEGSKSATRLLNNELCQLYKYRFEMVVCFFIISLSIGITVLSTYLNIMNAVTYTNFSQPCLFNISSALLYF